MANCLVLLIDGKWWVICGILSIRGRRSVVCDEFAESSDQGRRWSGRLPA